MGVGQPGVEREHRHLDAEAHEHAAEDPAPRSPCAMPGPPQRGSVACRTCAAARRRRDLGRQEVERQEADDHQRRAEQRVEEELDRRRTGAARRPTRRS